MASVPRRRRPCPHCGEPLSVRSRQTLFPGPLLTAAQLRAWTEYDRTSRFLRDGLAPVRTALLEAAEGPDPSETIDGVIERLLRALAASDRAYPELWLDRLARYRWEAGQSYVDVLAEARAVQLARYRAARRPEEPLEVAIVPGHPGALCDPCARLAHTWGDVRTMVGRLALPVIDCRCGATATRPGLCTCWYALRDRRLTPREQLLTDLLRAALDWWLDATAGDPARRRARDSGDGALGEQEVGVPDGLVLHPDHRLEFRGVAREE